MDNFFKQVQDFQKKLEEKQERLSALRFEASSGGGMVTVTADGKGEVLQISIDPDIVNKDDIKLLQDLVTAAVNEALKRSQESQRSEIAGIMGHLGLKIPTT